MFHLIWILSACVLLLFMGLFSVPRIGKLMEGKGITGVDVHKLERPEVPEAVGSVLVLLVSVYALFIYFNTQTTAVLWVFVVSLLFGIQGFVDDLVSLGKYQKLVTSSIFSLLGAYLFFTGSQLSIPFFLFAAFLLVVGSNIFNWFAGLNGLEIGLSTIITGFMALNLYLLGETVPFYLSLGLLAVLIPLLLYNKYPASVFPGDSGTLFVGAFLTGLTLYFGLWNIFLPLLSLHILNAFLKLFSAGYFSYSEKKPTDIGGDGKLTPREGFLSVVRLILKVRRMDEKKVVSTIWVLATAVGIATTVLVQGGVI